MLSYETSPSRCKILWLLLSNGSVVRVVMLVNVSLKTENTGDKE